MKQVLVPNFCRNSTLFMVVLYSQIIALCAYLLVEKSLDLVLFGFYSVYVQALSLGVFAALCFGRNGLNKLPTPYVDMACVAVVLLVFFTIECGVNWIHDFSPGFTWDQPRFFRLTFVVTVVAFLLVRAMYLFNMFEQRSQAEAQSRIQALQSRIRPHFLFNSLNTIAELVVSEPREAEQAVNALSVLFRANLETDSKFHSIGSEVELCEKYLSLEYWRLGEGLSVEWQVQVEEVSAWAVPKLVFQPLVENAILHGVQENGAVDIVIDIRETKKHISMMIKNTKGEQRTLHKGHGIAIENIRERLFALYDDQWSFRVREQNDFYQVIMRIPKHKRHEIT